MQPRTGRPDPRHRGGSAPAGGAHGANQCTRSGVGARLGCRRRPEGGMQATRSMGCWSSMPSRALHCDRHATQFLGVDRADGANSDQPRCDHRVASLAASLRRPRRPATSRSRSNASARAAPSTHCTSARFQVVRAHGLGGASHGQDSKFGEGQDADFHSSDLLHNVHYAKLWPLPRRGYRGREQLAVSTNPPQQDLSSRVIGHRTLKCPAHALIVYISRTQACTPKSPTHKRVYTFATSAVLGVH